MKTTVRTLAICALVVGAFCFGKSFSASSVKMDEFPELTAAKNHMLQAKTNLQKAASDFGGHKAKAMDHLEKAIGNIDDAIAYGDKH